MKKLLILLCLSMTGCGHEVHNLTESAIQLGCLRASVYFLGKYKLGNKESVAEAIEFCKNHKKLEE